MNPQLRQAMVTGRPSFWIAVVILALLLTRGFVSNWVDRELPFDSALWKNQEHLRPRMIRSLLGDYRLVGMSRSDIDIMLGKPSGRDSIRAGAYIYWAGADGVIDDRWLEIDFENDTATAARYVPD